MPVGFQFPLELAASRLEGVGYVLQEKQAEDDVLVLGSVDLTAQGVGRLPEDFGGGQVGGGYVTVRHAGFSPLLFGRHTPGHSGRYFNGLGTAPLKILTTVSRPTYGKPAPRPVATSDKRTRRASRSRTSAQRTMAPHKLQVNTTNP